MTRCPRFQFSKYGKPKTPVDAQFHIRGTGLAQLPHTKDLT